MNYTLVFLSVMLGLCSVSFAIALYKLNKANKFLAAQVQEYADALQDGHKAIQLALKYEDFYNSSVGDIGEVVDSLNTLVGKRETFSNDPDVQNLVRILSIAHDTLLGYMNAKSPRERQESSETEGSELL